MDSAEEMAVEAPRTSVVNSLLVAASRLIPSLGYGKTTSNKVAERAGVSALIVVLMATMTGVAGGVLRDVLSAEIPLILRPGDLYATASIAGAVTYLLLTAPGPAAPLASAAAMAVVVLLRLAAIVWGLRLPAVSPGEE